MNTKKPMNLGTQILLKNVTYGCFWFFSGIFDSIKFDYPVLKISSIVIMLVLLSMTFFFSFKKRDIKDELAQMHIGMASELTVGVTTLGILIFAIIANISNNFFDLADRIEFSVPIFAVLKFIVAFIVIMQGITFYVLEKSDNFKDDVIGDAENLEGNKNEF